jgi:hypothetical protein
MTSHPLASFCAQYCVRCIVLFCSLPSTAIFTKGERSAAVIFSYFDCEFGSHCTWEKEDGIASLSWLADLQQTSSSEGSLLLAGRTLWKVCSVRVRVYFCCVCVECSCDCKGYVSVHVYNAIFHVYASWANSIRSGFLLLCRS